VRSGQQLAATKHPLALNLPCLVLIPIREFARFRVRVSPYPTSEVRKSQIQNPKSLILWKNSLLRWVRNLAEDRAIARPSKRPFHLGRPISGKFPVFSLLIKEFDWRLVRSRLPPPPALRTAFPQASMKNVSRALAVWPGLSSGKTWPALMA
jgi:hypothetical protein